MHSALFWYHKFADAYEQKNYEFRMNLRSCEYAVLHYICCTQPELEAAVARRVTDLRRQDVVERLRAACVSVGGQRAWAQRNGLSLPYVNDVIGGRRAPGDGILRGLGLQRAEPRYEPRAPEEIALYDADGVTLAVAEREFD